METRARTLGFLASMVLQVGKWVVFNDEQHAEVAKRKIKASSTWSTKSVYVGRAKSVTISIVWSTLTFLFSVV